MSPLSFLYQSLSLFIYPSILYLSAHPSPWLHYYLLVPARLLDGPNPWTGRAEIFANVNGHGNSTWKAISNESKAANVLCRQLHFDGLARIIDRVYVRLWIPPIYLKCTGNEHGVHDCAMASQRKSGHPSHFSLVQCGKSALLERLYLVVIIIRALSSTSSCSHAKVQNL